MTDFIKIIRLGTGCTSGGRSYSIFCKIRMAAGAVSISGVEGPLPGGNAVGGCGQINMHLKPQSITPAPGWDSDKLVRFFAVWDRWHLNGTRAGSPAQEAELRRHVYDRSAHGEHYDWARQVLTAAGMQPDNGYSYGSAWLREEVPADVVEFLRSLPDTDKKPAWV